MADYRAYFLDDDGHFVKAMVLSCANDTAAVNAAEALVGDFDIEVWLLDRMVAQLKRDKE